MASVQITMPLHWPEELRVVSDDPRNRERWLRFLEGRPDATIFHHPLWLEVIARESRQEVVVLICENSSGDVQGVLPLLATRGMPFFGARTARRLSSLPRTPVAGPIASTPQALRALVEAALFITDHERPESILEIKSFRPDLEVPGLRRMIWRSTYVLPLVAGSHLRFGSSRKHHRIMWAVRRAINLGVHVAEARTLAEVQGWYALYLETMRWHAIPARSLSFFEDLWTELYPRGLLRLLIATHGQGPNTRMIAGSIFLSFGETVFYAFNGRRRQDMRLHGNDLLLWTALTDAAARVFKRFDFGEVNERGKGLQIFKTKWGAEAQQLYRYYSNAHGARPLRRFDSTASHDLITTMWRRMPLRATSLLGNWANRFL